MDPLLDHRATEINSSTDAHTIMQDHKECPATVCAAKLQAKLYLVHHGLLQPRTNSRDRFGF